VKTDLQDVTETRKTLAVTLDPEETAAEERALIGEFKNQAKIPGFRPGKAPDEIVRKRFGKPLSEELRNRVLGKAYRDGTKQAAVDLANVIDVKEGDIDAGAETTVTFTIDVFPAFETPEHKGLELQGASTEVDPSEIDQTIENLRRERAEFAPVDREAASGDYVKFSHEGRIDGQPIDEIAPEKPVYAKMPQTWEEAGSDEGLIPGLAKALVGMKAGDRKDVEVAFPDDFSVEPLQGKRAVYAVEVQEVRERKLPEIDEAFLKEHQVESLDEFKERVGDMLRMSKDRERRADLRNQASQALLEQVEFPLPESLVDQETEQALRRIVNESVQRGATQEQLEASKEELRSRARASALQRVKLNLILERIAEKEGIETGEEDIRNWLLTQAYQSGQNPQTLAKELRKDQDRARAIQRSLLHDKTLEFVVREAKVIDSAAASA